MCSTYYQELDNKWIKGIFTKDFDIQTIKRLRGVEKF